MKKTKAVLEVDYNDLVTGQFKDAQTIPIVRLRSYVKDMIDSPVWPEDFFQVKAMANGAIASYTESGVILTGVADGALMIDGVAVLAGDYIILKNEGEERLNGLYIVNDAGDVTDPFIIEAIGPESFNRIYYIQEGDTYEGIAVSRFTGSSSSYDTLRGIAAAGVLTLNATPVQLQGAPGAGKALVVTDIIMTMEFNTTPYSGNVSLEFFVGSTSLVGEVVGFLDSTINRVVHYQVTVQDIEINQPLTVMVPVGNPSDGDSNVKFQVTYKIVTL